ARARDHRPYARTRDQPADEQPAAPRGERIARVPLRAGRRDDGVPVVDRLLVARALGLRRLDRPARVLLAVRDERPAVILAGLDQVQLVAAARPVLDGPEPALQVERHRLEVAMAERPDL